MRSTVEPHLSPEGFEGDFPLVGREAEVRRLALHLESKRNAGPATLLLHGEAGVGKSRLLHEFRRSLAGERVTWLAGHCLAYGQSTAYLPIVDILHASFRVDGDDNRLQVDEKLRHGLRGLDPALEEILPVLRELVLATPDDALKGLDPKARYRVRVTYARDRQGQIRLEAEGKEIHPLMVKPPATEPQEFDVPPETTADGELTLKWFREAGRGGNGRGCQVREVWLIRKAD